MSASMLAAIRHSFLMTALAVAGATIAFGTVMLSLPITREAAVTEDGAYQQITDCELLPIGDVNSCTIQR